MGPCSTPCADASCTDDASCPGGFTCEVAYVEAPANGAVTFTRMCLPNRDPNNSADNPYQRMP